jgi:hypothetical protein
MTLLPTVAAFREIRIIAKQIAARVSQEPPLIPCTGNGSTERPADEEISKHNPAAQAKPSPQEDQGWYSLSRNRKSGPSA